MRKAIEYYKKAIAKGHINAHFNLALLYETGRGVQQDFEKAVDLYHKAAEMGDADSMYQLVRRRSQVFSLLLSVLSLKGWAYDLGQGTTRNPRKASEVTSSLLYIFSFNSSFLSCYLM